jgi:hypothetical protein
MLQKELLNVLGTDSLHTLNVFIGRELGAHASDNTSLFYAWQSKLLLHPLFNPGIELYGEIANLTSAGQYKDQGHSIGPVITGSYIFAPHGKIRYELGYQWGLSKATARGGVRWKFEYEIPFWEIISSAGVAHQKAGVFVAKPWAPRLCRPPVPK